MLNESDSDFLIQMKSEEAHQKYIDDIDLMYEYSYQHEEKILEIEADVKTMIEEWTASEEEISCIWQIWMAEVKKNEKISQQLWKNRLDFLLKKKREEEEQDDTRFINEEQEKEIKKRSHLKKDSRYAGKTISHLQEDRNRTADSSHHLKEEHLIFQVETMTTGDWIALQMRLRLYKQIKLSLIVKTREPRS